MISSVICPDIVADINDNHAILYAALTALIEANVSIRECQLQRSRSALLAAVAAAA